MKKILAISIFLISFILPQFAHADITTGLQVWWKFNEGTTTAPADSSGNGNTGSFSTSNPTWSTFGKIWPYMLSFSSGAIQYVNAPAVFNIANPTESAWFNVASAPAAQGCMVTMMNGQPSGTFDHDIEMTTAGKIAWYIFDGGAKVVTSTSTYADGTWHHVAATADGTNMYLYVDGFQVASTSAGNAFTSYTVNNFFAGSDTGSVGGNNCSKMSIKLNEVRLYNRALTASDILQLYAYPVADVTSNRLVRYSWDNADTTYTLTGTINDTSGNGTNATFNTTPSGTGSSTPGKINEGVRFTGTTNSINGGAAAPSGSLVIGTGDFSISVWSKAANNAFSNILSTQNSGATNNGYALYWNGGLLNWVVSKNPSAQFVTKTITMDGSTWHHFVVTYSNSGGRIVMYVDGVATSSNATGVPQGNITNIIASPKIGHVYASNPAQDISLDEMCVYSRELNPNDVISLYNGGAGATCTSSVSATVLPRLILFGQMILKGQMIIN